MRRFLIVVLLAALAGLAVACGSSGSGGQPGSPPPLTAAQVAHQHGLAVTGKVNPPTLFAAGEVNATDSAGTTYDVAVFTSNQTRDNWVKAAAEFGSVLKWEGDRWAILSG